MISKLPLLSLLETRVLGVLVEKERTVVDTYPMSLNALTSGCNQKSNREPVIEATDAEVQAAVDALKARTMVIESSGARVARYSHNVGRVLRVPDQAVGAAGGVVDAARRPDQCRAADRHRAAAPVRRHLLGRRVPGRAGGPRPGPRGTAGQAAGPPARRARGALDALPVGYTGRGQRAAGLPRTGPGRSEPVGACGTEGARGPARRRGRATARTASTNSRGSWAFPAERGSTGSQPGSVVFAACFRRPRGPGARQPPPAAGLRAAPPAPRWRSKVATS